MNQFELAKEKDRAMHRTYAPAFIEPLELCRCGGKVHIDTSMALIVCDQCGLCFEYRYDRGVIPYHTWQLIARLGG